MYSYFVSIKFTDGSTTSQQGFNTIHDATAFIDYVAEKDCDDKYMAQVGITRQTKA